MILNDLDTAQLLPMGASGKDERDVHDRLKWVCDVFDQYVHTIDARRYALAAPYSAESIYSLTDQELQRYYEEFGLATYYPDIDRASRQSFLHDQLVKFRKLGTKAALQSLIQYIFGPNPVSLDIIDNLAFDSEGILINESLLNMYDCVVNIANPQLDRFQLGRIFSNLTKFNRNSQKLRAIKLNYDGGDISRYIGAGSLDTAYFYDNDWVNCQMPNPSTLIIGVDSTCPSNAIGLEMDNLYWFYEFSGGSSYNNLWNPMHYADNAIPQYPDPSELTIPSAYYANVWLNDGYGNIYDMSTGSETFKLSQYNARPEFYTSMSTPTDSGNAACLIELQPGSQVFGGITTFSVPSALYTRNDDVISWDSTNPMYPLLLGKTARIKY